ncbi:MAG: hypothetical protein E6150_11140 [Prevotella bivia]|nr:hypothetical protein [Prevotella bivia]
MAFRRVPPRVEFYVRGKAWTEWMRKEFSGVFERWYFRRKAGYATFAQ